MNACTFCGSRTINASDAQTKNVLYYQAEELVQKGCKRFYCGNYGQFDRLAAKICKELKKKYQDIEINLVISYYRPKKSESEIIYRAQFDHIILPPMENVPYRYRIIRSNEYRIDLSDIVIAYIRNNFGGAAQSVLYAKKRKKKIIMI